MVRLYTEDSLDETDAGIQFGDEIEKAITPIVKKFTEMGYCIRDMETIMMKVVSITGSMNALDHRNKVFKERKLSQP